MKKLFIVALASAALFSCTAVLKTYYGAGAKNFEDRQAVVDYYQEKNNIEPKGLYFFDSHKDYLDAVQADMRLMQRSHFGVAVNDSVLVDDLVQAGYYCRGVSAKSFVGVDTLAGTLPNPLYKKGLKNIYGEQLALNRSRPTIIVLASGSGGTLLKREINYYKEETAKAGKEFNYVFIVMDVPRQNPEGYFAAKQ